MFQQSTQTEITNLLYNIAWLRKRYGLSKKRMAALLGISIGTVNKIEQAELPPRVSVEIVFLLHRHFGVRPKDVFSKRLDKA